MSSAFEIIMVPVGKLFCKHHSFRMSKFYAKPVEKIPTFFGKGRAAPQILWEMLVLICIILNYGAYRKWQVNYKYGVISYLSGKKGMVWPEQMDIF